MTDKILHPKCFNRTLEHSLVILVLCCKNLFFWFRVSLSNIHLIYLYTVFFKLYIYSMHRNCYLKHFFSYSCVFWMFELFYTTNTIEVVKERFSEFSGQGLIWKIVQRLSKCTFADNETPQAIIIKLYSVVPSSVQICHKWLTLEIRKRDKKNSIIRTIEFFQTVSSALDRIPVACKKSGSVLFLYT